MEKEESVANTLKFVTPEEYLKIDSNSERKVEYLEGEIFVNQGETLNHNKIVSHLIGKIAKQLKGTESIMLANQMRVASPKLDFFSYPDASITKGKIQLYESIFDTLVNPTIIFEVVSSTSGGNDYSTKFFHYKQIPFLQEYVLINSFEDICVDVFRRQPNNLWLNETYLTLDETLVLQSVNAFISMKDIYENVTFETKEEI